MFKLYENLNKATKSVDPDELDVSSGSTVFANLAVVGFGAEGLRYCII